MPLDLGKVSKEIHKGCVFGGNKIGTKAIKILKIIRDASSLANHISLRYTPY